MSDKKQVLPPDPVFVFRTDTGYVHSLCFVYNTDYAYRLLAATESGLVYFYDLESSRMLFRQMMGSSIITILTYEDQIITQEKEGIIKHWELKKKSYGVTKTYNCLPGFCKIVMFDDKLIVPKENYVVEVITLETFEVVRKFVAEDPSTYGQMTCTCLIQVATQLCVVVGFDTGDLILFHFDEENQRSHLKMDRCVNSLTFDCNKVVGVCSNSFDSLLCFKVEKSFKMVMQCVMALTYNGNTLAKLRSDGNILVCGGIDGRVRVVSWYSLRTLAVLTKHRAGVEITDVAFSEKPVNTWGNKVMATSSADGTIAIWCIYNNFHS